MRRTWSLAGNEDFGGLVDRGRYTLKTVPR